MQIIYHIIPDRWGCDTQNRPVRTDSLLHH